MIYKVIDNHSIRINQYIPEYIDYKEILAVTDLNGSIIKYTAKRDRTGFLFISIDDSYINQNIMIKVLFAKIIDRKLNETDSNYFSKLVFHLNQLKKESNKNLSNIIHENEFKVYNMNPGTYSDKNNFDLSEYPFFKYFHDIVFNTLAKPFSKNKLSIGFLVEKPVLFIYHASNVRNDNFIFTTEKYSKKDTVEIGQNLFLSSFYFNELNIKGYYR